MADEQEDEQQRSNPNSFKARAKAPIQEAMRGLSTSLMQGAFESFGRAFTDTGYRGHRSGSGLQGIAAGTAGGGMDAWREAGARAATGLEKRWHTMELEDLKQTDLARANEQIAELATNYRKYKGMLNDGVWVNEDGTMEKLPKTEEGQERLRRYHGELQTDVSARTADIMASFSQSAARFPNNPLVAELVATIFTQSSKQMQEIANPEDSIASEKAHSDITVQERNSRAAMINARAQSAAAAKAIRPVSIAEALRDPLIGVRDILAWTEQNMLAGPDGEAYRQQMIGIATPDFHDRLAKEQVASGEIKKLSEYDKVDPENIEWVDNQLAQAGPQLQQGAAALMLKAKDPKAYEAAKSYAPHYYEILEGDKRPDAPKGVKDKRITENQRDLNVKAWKQPLADKLDEYMSDPNNNPDIDVAIDYIINDWLPGAITGSTTSSAPSSIQATQSENTAEYRKLVIRFARKYLETNFDKISGIAKDRNKEKARRARNLRASRLTRRGRRSGGMGRAVNSLFGDE